METSSLPQLHQLRDYGHAVAGHAGTLCDEDGKLFIKPCTQKEVDFYEGIQREASNPDPSKEKYRELQSIMPKFMGTLTLTDPEDDKIEEAVTGVISQAGGVETDKQQMSAAVTEQISKSVPAGQDIAAEGDWVPTNGGKIKTNTAIVLDNASSGFKKANILDLKMGVRLHADNAPAKKKQKMDKITEETTHKTHGFRVAGMRVYHGSNDGYSEVDEDGFMIYDKDYGRNTVTSENVTSEISKFVFNRSAGIDKELAKAVCRGLAHQVEEVEEILSKFETRMFSASLLIVMEGDGKTLSKAIEQNNAAVEAVEAGDLDWTTKRVDSGIVLDDDGEFSEETLAPMFKIRLIDFAHAEIKEPSSTKNTEGGDDPHESLLLGVRSVKQIFEELGRD